VDDQRLGVADVGEVREDTQRFDELLASWPAGRGEEFLQWAKTAFERPIDLRPFRT